MFESILNYLYKREWSHKVTPQYYIDEQEKWMKAFLRGHLYIRSRPHKSPLIYRKSF